MTGWLAAVIAAVGLCAPARGMTQDAARTAAAAINLVPADVPGFEAEPVSVKRPDERPVAGCPRLDLLERRVMVHEESPAFFRGRAALDRELHSQVEILPSVSQAKLAVAMLRSPRMPRCLERTLRSDFGGELHLTRVTVRRIVVPAPRGALGFRFRIGYVRFGHHGISVSELRFFRRGPAMVALETSAPNQPAAPSLVDPLLRLLAQRAAAALR